MKHLLFGIKYIVGHELLKKKTPLICGIVLHNKCNLRCKHCRIIQREMKALSYDEVVSVLDNFYSQGGRCLYLEGGEPFLWKHNSHNLEDIIQYAKNKGYLATVIYTNGTRPLTTTADTVFISMDGLKKTNDHLRGKSFDRIINNIQQSNHPSLYINFTINTINKAEIESFCQFIQGIKKIKGIFFYFHTPYYGYDDLFIEREERNKILSDLIKFKSKYKILNSRAGLQSAIRNNWAKAQAICKVYEDGEFFNCCRYPDNPELCDECGYLSYAEIYQTLKLKPSAIRNALKYF